MNETFQARWLLPNPFHVLPGAALVVQDGRVGEVRSGLAAGATGSTDLGNAVLVPGFVNAHAHLELPALEPDVSRSFLPWVSAVIKRRAELSLTDYERQVRLGATRLLQTGTTCVGDVDSSGASSRLLPGMGLRARVYRELLDGDDPGRTPSQLELLDRPWPENLDGGLSPHGPHTVSDPLLEACVRQAEAESRPLSVHWSETPEEVEWLERGEGPLAKFLRQSPACSGLQRMERAGALGPSLSLVHGNEASPQELGALARHGVSLIHCPGTHRYFQRPAAPLEQWASLGLQVALGTDSLASNDDLDMGREMQLLRREHPGLDPAVVLEWATRGGARALSMQDSIGDLSVGKWADFIALDASGMESTKDVVEGVTGGHLKVLGVWVAGRACHSDHFD